MPLIQIQHVAGSFSREEQERFIKEITQVFVNISGEVIRPHVLVTITEITSGLWGTGGVPLTIEMIESVNPPRGPR